MATALAAVGIVLIYQATVFDSWAVGGVLAKPLVSKLATGSRVEVEATAYCKGHTTASGVAVKAGIAAGDPDFLPEGSVIKVEGVPERYVGIYTVLDTGPKIQGRKIDLYMWSCVEALAFGRRPVTVSVVRLGWNPNHIKPRVK